MLINYKWIELGRNLKTYGKLGLTALVLSGIGSCTKSCISHMPKPYVMPNPSELDYTFANAHIRDYSTAPYGEDLVAKDFNEDGEVDALVSAGIARWVAPEFVTNQNWNYQGRAKIMSPELRSFVTKLNNDSRKGAVILADESYKFQEKIGEK